MSKEKNSQTKKKEDISVELNQLNHEKIRFYASMPSENVVIVQESSTDTFDTFVSKVLKESETSERLKGVLTLVPMHFKDYKRFLHTLDELTENEEFKNIKGTSIHELYNEKIFTSGDYCVFINYNTKSVTIFFLDNLSNDFTVFSSKVASLQLILKNVIRTGIIEIKNLTETDPYAIIIKNNSEWNTKGITQLEYLTMLDMNKSELFSIGKDTDQTHIYIYMMKNNEISPLYGDFLNDSDKSEKTKKKKERKKKKKK